MEYKGMKLSEAKRVLRSAGFKVIKETANNESMQKTVKVYFENGQDGLVANDCFQSIAAEKENDYTDGIIAFDCFVKNEYDYLIIQSITDPKNVDELVAQIQEYYDEYLPKVEEITAESFKKFASDNGYKFVSEAEEPAYMNGHIGYRDRRSIEQGRAPFWAKSVKDVPARKKEIRQSSAPSEIAMRSVTTANGRAKKPYTESDWKADKEARKISNEKLMKALEVLLPIDSVKYSFDDKEVSAVIGDYVFRVSPRGSEYYVLRFNSNSVLDRKNQMCKSLDEVVKFIKANCE